MKAPEALGRASTAAAPTTVEATKLELVADLAAPQAPRFSVVIGRRLGTVMVTVHGEVDTPRANRLGHILADLIDGQGNLSLVVDLHDATAADADSLSVFVEAAERARRRGGTVTLAEAPADLGAALQLRGLDRFVGADVEVRASRGGGT